jgi:thymidylate synthase (FAD)
VIGEQIVARWVPLTWEAFLDFRMGADSLSRIEAEILAALGVDDAARAVAIAQEAGWLATAPTGDLVRSRERLECEGTLAALGLAAPWSAD